jgi:hypothetical protein
LSDDDWEEENVITIPKKLSSFSSLLLRGGECVSVKEKRKGMGKW